MLTPFFFFFFLDVLIAKSRFSKSQKPFLKRKEKEKKEKSNLTFPGEELF